MKSKLFCLHIVMGILFFAFLIFSFEIDAEQEDQINELKAELLSLKRNALGDYAVSDNSIREYDFAYLAIGNSITVHGECDHWWNTMGMAATKPDNDYFHIFSRFLESQYDEIKVEAFNYSGWESMENDRAELLYYLDRCLYEDLDLISIQLGENVSDLSDYEFDYLELINYVKQKAPRAKIIIIGDFWWKYNRDKIEKDVAEKSGVEYISLREIQGKKAYKCGKNTKVLGADGQEYTVKRYGTAKHQNDKAMDYIAQRIMEKYKQIFQ